MLFTALDGPLSKGELVVDVAEDGCLPTLLTGPGGVGKTTLAGLFARILQERNPSVRLLGLQAPFALDAVHEILWREALDGSEEPTLLERLKSGSDVRERISCLLTSLARRKRPCAVVLDNLKSLQQLQILDVSAEHADSLWFVRAVCNLPAPTRVLLTGRYGFPGLPAHVQVSPVPDAPYGDVLLKMNWLRWPPKLELEKKRRVYAVLGGNHRAPEWTVQLLTDQQPQGEALLEALARLQIPPETPEDTVAVVHDAMRQNLLFPAVRQQLTPAQGRLLRAACLGRVPINADGLLALESQPEQAESNRQRLLAYALLEPAYDPQMELDYFFVPPIVKELLGAGNIAGWQSAPGFLS
ncbi:MAG: ATP-binding protein [Deltaproteobacteria bacterium]|nr:ATP-binding protein [Deltaproteobacteria bacterium]